MTNEVNTPRSEKSVKCLRKKCVESVPRIFSGGYNGRMFSIPRIRCLEPSAMDARDLEDYWNEYHRIQEARTPSDEYADEEDSSRRQEEEGEEEAQWLRSAGLSSLAEAWVAGREVAEAEVAPALRTLPPHHASAVRRRVDSLNRTLRARRRRRRDGGPPLLPEEGSPPTATSSETTTTVASSGTAPLAVEEEDGLGGSSRRRVAAVAVGRKCAYNRSRPRKPDIREVFKDIEASSTGTRSRSATPDSLDLDYSEGERGSGRNGADSGERATASSTSSLSDGASSSSPPVPRFVQVFHPPPPHFLPRPQARHPLSALPPSHPRIVPKDPVRRVHSLGHDRFILTTESPSPSASPPSSHNLFRRSQWADGVVANDTAEGIRMVGYQQIGTLHLPRSRERRSGSDPSSPTPISSSPTSPSHLVKKTSVEYSPSQRGEEGTGGALHFPLRRAASQGLQGIRAERWNLGVAPGGLSSSAGGEEWAWQSPWAWGPGPEGPSDEESCGRTWVWSLGDEDVVRLRPLALLEATALLDEYGVTQYRKGHKGRRKKPKNRKDDGNAVFGVPISTLLQRDKELTGEDVKVPLILQKLIGQLDCGLCEQGILRVAGHNAKVESAKLRLDQDVYRAETLNSWNIAVDSVLSACSVHDLSALLKRLLRDLPEPLLTQELVETFYRCHVVPEKNGERLRALNSLALMLPAANRDFLRAVLSFLERVSNHESSNRMSAHNVAMVMAPNLFPPLYVDLLHKGNGANAALEAQVEFAAVTSRLTEASITAGDNLWLVPPELLAGMRRQCLVEKKQLMQKENSRPMKKLLGRRNAAHDEKEINGEPNDGMLRISAPQLGITEFTLRPLDVTTAGDVVLRLMEEAFRNGKSGDGATNKSREARRAHIGVSSRPLVERFAANMVSSLSSDGSHVCPYLKQVGRGGESPTATDALTSHSLYEVGGNLHSRQLEHSASLVAVLKQNPAAHWVVCCHHQREFDSNGTTIPAASPSVNISQPERQNGSVPHENQRYF